MPMIVRQSATPATMCATPSHQPQKMIHRTLPIAEATPAAGSRTTVAPNGHSVYAAIRSAAIANGVVGIHQTTTNAQQKAGEDEPEDVEDDAHRDSPSHALPPAVANRTSGHRRRGDGTANRTTRRGD